MNTAYVYLQLYKMFDQCTPINVDCGRLCNKACCQGDDMGMYLFPGEEAVFTLLSPKWISIKSSDFTYNYNGKEKKLKIAFCNGDCDRYQRPLSCRIFPLTPILKDNGELEIIVDPRSKAICPLGRLMKKTEFSGRFLKNLYRAFSLLMKNKEFAQFMVSYTEYLKEYLKFY